MTLDFETTHEYYLRDGDIHYCAEHEALIVTRDYQDRLLINGIDYKTMLQFATKFYQNDLEKTIKSYNDKDAVDKEAVEAD